MDNIKIIALDMDGVVNSDHLIYDWLMNKREELKSSYNNDMFSEELRLAVRQAFNDEFDHSTELVFPELASRITKICNETDAYILWSSTWRKLDKYQDIEVAKDMFNRRGLPGNKLIGYTPSIGMSWGGNCRGSEISSWIHNNTVGNIIKCAVIDDRLDAGYNLPSCAKYFQTFCAVGINDYDVEDIINYLNKE